MINKYRRFFPFIALIIVSLIPLFWYVTGGIVIGHDTGWSLVPIERFIDRLYVWSRVGFGIDQTLDVGAVSFYGMQALFSGLGLSIITVQKVSFIFWFAAMSISMYYLSVTVYKGKNNKLLGVIAGIFYSINHYTLQAWGVAELSKFSEMTLFPIILALVWGITAEKKITARHLLLISIAFLFFNGGGGSGLPLYGGMTLVFIILFFYKWLIEKTSVFLLLKTYIVVGVVAVLTGMYWIIPMIHVLTSQYATFAGGGGVQGVISWTDVISKNTSLINLLRLQGFSGWYDEPLHPYSHTFLNNPFFLAGGIGIPIFVFLSFLLAHGKKERTIVIFFLGVLLFSLLFVAGTHTPFGFFYAFLEENLYGFAIFRTAFYKFGYALWFSYAFLFAFSTVKVKDIIPEKNLKILFIGIVVAFLTIYNYPFFSTSFFNFDLPFKTLVNLPDYIFQSKSYIQKLPNSSRILLIPPPSPTNGQTDIYTYGYFSRTPLPYELTQKSIVTNLEINSPAEERFTEELYSAILANDEEKVKSLIKLTGISDILVRNDVLTQNLEYKVDSPFDYVKNLERYSWIKKSAKYGKWDFYHITFPAKKVYAVAPNFSFTFGDIDAAVKILNFSADEITTNPEFFDLLKNNSSKVTIHTKCSICADTATTIIPPAPIILPNSPLYILAGINEIKKMKSAQSDPVAYFGTSLYYSEKHALELSSLARPNPLSNNNFLDIEKKTELVANYASYLNRTNEAFQKLSYDEKLQLVQDYENSLMRQRDYLLQVSKSNFFSDLNDEYGAMYASVNKMIQKKELKDLLSYRSSHYIYSFQVPLGTSYASAFDTAVENPVIDGRPLISDSFIPAGSHTVSINIPKNEIILENEKSFQLKLPKTISLQGLKQGVNYNISMNVHLDALPSVRTEVVDSTGKNLSTKNLINNTDEYWKKLQLTFKTESSGSKYNFTIRPDGDISINTVLVKDLLVERSEKPILSLESKSKTTVKNTPGISYSYISPVHYTVSVSHAQGPFVLVLNETFSPLWSARINGAVVANHFPADMAFNGWYVNKNGDYVIDIRVSFQAQYYIGVGITVGVVAGLMLFYLLQKYIYGRKN